MLVDFAMKVADLACTELGTRESEDEAERGLSRMVWPKLKMRRKLLSLYNNSRQRRGSGA